MHYLGPIISPKTADSMRLNRLGFVFTLLCVVPVSSAAAQSITAYKTGEQTTGTTKQCFYDALGNPYTVTISSIKLCPLSIRVGTSSPESPRLPSLPAIPAPSSFTAYKTGEQETGSTKQCYYDGLGNPYTRTVKSIELCPLSIQVRH